MARYFVMVWHALFLRITGVWGILLTIRLYNGEHTTQGKGKHNDDYHHTEARPQTRTDPRRNRRGNQQQGAAVVPSEVRLPVDNPRQRCRDWTQERGLDNLPLHRLRTSHPGDVGCPLRWEVGLTAAGVSGTIHTHNNTLRRTTWSGHSSSPSSPSSSTDEARRRRGRRDRVIRSASFRFTSTTLINSDNTGARDNDRSQHNDTFTIPELHPIQH